MGKKIVLLVLVSLLVFSLVGCGPSKEVKEVESVINAIDAIGEITLESGAAIVAAEEAYNNLPEEGQLSVTNYELLLQMREKYDAIKNAEDLASSGDLLGAYYALNNVAKEKRDASFEQRIENARDNVISDSTLKANNMLGEFDYVGVYELLSSLPNDFKSDEIQNLINMASDSYEADILSKAESQVASGDYDSAIKILNDAYKQMPLAAFLAAVEDYQNESDIAFLQSAKNQVAVKYDNIGKTYAIGPPGLSLDNLNISTNRNVEPAVRYAENKGTIFAIAIGFQQRDWIFIDKILIDCDGEQYEYKISYGDRQSQVLYGGGVVEWYWLKQYPIQGIDFSDLSGLIESMSTANTVTIRFSGKGKLDVVIPKNHIDELETLWKIYNILDRNSSLISYLK